MFTANENNRRPLGSRLQNGKLDLGAPRQDASWLPSAATSTRMGAQSFAQTIGGGAQNRPFDPSEFPSLGGGGQPAGASSWGANLRQRSPERRPYGRGMGRTQDEQSTADVLPPGAEGYQFGGGRTNQTAVRNPTRSPLDQEPIGYTGRQDAGAALPVDSASSPPGNVATASNDTAPPAVKRTTEMTDRERYGIAGLVSRSTVGSPDFDPLMNGFDLTKLGINMDSTDRIIDTWAGPFDDTNYVVPEFNVPPAYMVNNVPPLESKMESFSDETLIMIFYQYPRDYYQELAAQMLYKRDWRWHTKLRCWMMKDTSAHNMSGFGQSSVRLSEKVERGMYILFDVSNWRRERKEITLNFDDLDTRPSLMQGAALGGANANLGAPVVAPTNGFGTNNFGALAFAQVGGFGGGMGSA